MDYFVTIEDRAYHHWQAELLLESMRQLDISDKLFVGVVPGNQGRYGFLHNYNEHTNKESFIDLGKAKGFAPLNELHILSWAVNAGRIKSPFCILKPHTVLRHNNSQPFPYPDYPGIMVAPDPFFTFDNAAEMVPEFWTGVKKTEEEVKNNWVPYGNICFLNNIGLDFVNQLIRYAEQLAVFQIRRKREIWADTIRLAWAIIIGESMGKAYVESNLNLAATMIDNRLAPIIDYEHGMPPTFNKESYSFPPPMFLSLGDPIAQLTEFINTSNAHFMGDLAKANISRRKV